LFFFWPLLCHYSLHLGTAIAAENSDLVACSFEEDETICRNYSTPASAVSGQSSSLEAPGPDAQPAPGSESPGQLKQSDKFIIQAKLYVFEILEVKH